MIKILVKREDKKFISLEVKGHANSAEYGKDLICAAVSSILTGGFNSLENIKSFNVKLEEGNALLEKKEEISSHDEIVIETMITQLQTIEESNNKFIQIKNL